MMDEVHEVSNPSNKIPVLTCLKRCVKNIEDEVYELKQSFNSIDFKEEEEVKTSSCLEKSQDIKKRINYFKHECENIKQSLYKDIKKTASYFYDMEDLTLDIEEEVGILEKHLKNYGYVPPQLDTFSVQESEESESVFDDHCCENEILKEDLSETPEFHIDIASLAQKRDKKKESVEDEPSTPELVVQSEEPEKKPRHILLSSPVPFSVIGSSSKLGDVARRLYF